MLSPQFRVVGSSNQVRTRAKAGFQMCAMIRAFSHRADVRNPVALAGLLLIRSTGDQALACASIVALTAAYPRRRSLSGRAVQQRESRLRDRL